MKRKRYSYERIASALRQAEGGTTVEEICRKQDIPGPTFTRWKKQFAGMGTVEVCRLKQLEEENAKLKRLVADLSLDKTMLQDVLRRKGWARRSARGGGCAARHLPGQRAAGGGGEGSAGAQHRWKGSGGLFCHGVRALFAAHPVPT